MNYDGKGLDPRTGTFPGKQGQWESMPNLLTWNAASKRIRKARKLQGNGEDGVVSIRISEFS